MKFSNVHSLFFSRSVLDFDFEKLCSITLSNNNVYACLVCGKYFQGMLYTPTYMNLFIDFSGRGQKSCAYTHSVEGEHHVFINLHSLQFFCLPDNYEIIDSSLDDIKVIENIL
jgi:U4/U6.U5 tri-snRNP-associated protein 2